LSPLSCVVARLTILVKLSLAVGSSVSSFEQSQVRNACKADNFEVRLMIMYLILWI